MQLAEFEKKFNITLEDIRRIESHTWRRIFVPCEPDLLSNFANFMEDFSRMYGVPLEYVCEEVKSWGKENANS
jgi:hypothetical protein